MNEIVGQSKDNKQAVGLIQSIGDIGTAINKIARQLGNHEKRITDVEDTMRVNGIQEKKLTDAVNKKVLSWLDGKESNAYQNHSLRGRVYSAINKDIKNKFGVPRRAEVPAKDFHRAMMLIEHWELDFDLKREIFAMNNAIQLFDVQEEAL